MPKPTLRIFKFSDAYLKQKSDSVAESMDRDGAEFTLRGITNVMTEAFADLSTAFGSMDSDEMWIGNVTDATQTKDALAAGLKSQARIIRNMAEIKWTTKSGRYRSYGFDDMDGLNDNNLVRLGRRIITVATDQEADLASEGFTPAMLTAFTSVVDDFDDSVDNKIDVEKERDIAQQDRVEAGNELYGFLDKYCSIGKSMWFSDPAKFNDYVIYPSGSGEEEPPVEPPL